MSVTPVHSISDSTTTRMVVRELPPGDKEKRAVALTIARVLSVPAPPLLGALQALPAVIPARLAGDEAELLARKLHERGARVERQAKVLRSVAPCRTHPKLDSCTSCKRCRAPLCVLCERQSRHQKLCRACSARARRASLFFRLRVSALLVILACVLLYAWRDVQSRRARNQWNSSLSVGLVLIRGGPLEPGVVDVLQTKVHALEDKLAAEFERYQPGHPKPFLFTVYGPVDHLGSPPHPSPGWSGAVRFAAELWWYLRGVNVRAGIDSGSADAMVYLYAQPPKQQGQQFIEGLSEQGGRVGIVEVELDRTMADFALFVAAHELLHTLGATDKYDSSGFALEPTGLADPDRVPLYPQSQAEIMARNIPMGPRAERPPTSLQELRVGRFTAQEIGWLARQLGQP